MDSPHFEKKKPFTNLPLCSAEEKSGGEITLVRRPKLDIDQNIADLRLNIYLISMASGLMRGAFGALFANDFRSKSAGCHHSPQAARSFTPGTSLHAPDGTVSLGWIQAALPGYRIAPDGRYKKKGAQRAPPTPTESLQATTRSRHHKTHVEYGYLSPVAF
jgi:hypothetical protein